jgi:hypothetical protein
MKFEKICAHCKSVFTPNHRLGQKRIAKMQFCSRDCTNKSRRIVFERNCASCGTLFTPSNNRGKYCTKTCAASAHKGPKGTKNKPEKYRRITGKDGTRQLEHRVVMEKILGRPLEPGENVHHKNGNRLDNNPANLELWYRGQPAGQRVDDLIAYVVKHHSSKLRQQLCCLFPDQCNSFHKIPNKLGNL